MDAHQHSVSPEDDNFPYEKLDEFSKKIRQSAFEFAAALSDIVNKSKEISLLIRALSQIHTTDIRHIDHALTNFKKAFATLTMRNVDNSIFGAGIPDDLLMTLLDKYSVFIQDTAELGQKAFDLVEK